jgi:hypothetical protein
MHTKGEERSAKLSHGEAPHTLPVFWSVVARVHAVRAQKALDQETVFGAVERLSGEMWEGKQW